MSTATLTKAPADFNGITEQQKSLVTFAGIDVADLAVYADQDVDWLVEGVFGCDQPTFFAARSKGLKTTQLVDLSVALASQTAWLGSFKIPKQRRVLFITGESNYRAIGRRIRKACEVRGLTLADLAGWLRVEAIDFPSLPDLADCLTVAGTVAYHSIGVIIVDPLF
jgi:hypothetical protein